MKELYSENIATVLSAIDELYQNEQNYKKSWAAQAKRCVAFANGDQNPSPTGAPTMVNNNPVNSAQGDNRVNMYQTNEIEPIVRTLVSYMTRAKPVAECFAVDEEPKSKGIAKVAERINTAKYDLDNEAQNSSDGAFWALATGNVFGKDYWDPSKGQKKNSPILDQFGNPQIDESTGQPVMDNGPTGNNATAVLTAFSMTLDHSNTNFETQAYIGENHVMDIDWARESFDSNAPGYTGLAAEITEDGYAADTLNTLEEMKFSIPYSSAGAGTRQGTKGKCLVREWYIAPNREYPRGRLIIVAGGKVVYLSSQEQGSPYFLDTEQTIWHPYTMFRYEPYIGRLLGKSLVEQLIPLQMRLNEINGAILENANTLAKPNIMAAVGQLKRGIMNGHGANIYTFQHIPGAPPPYILTGAQLPSQFFNERALIIEQMSRIAGTNTVMSGNAPTGVTAAQAIDSLLENSKSQLSNAMILWERYHEQRFTKKLRIIHKFNVYPDKTLSRKLREITDSCLDTNVKDFIGSTDLSDGINIRIQSGSMIPKSEVAKISAYTDLAKAGVLSPHLQEPGPIGDKAREALLEKMGLESLESDESTEFKKAKWENERILSGEPVEVSEYDNSPIHLPCHISKIQSPKFLENATDEQKIALDDHIKAHRAEDMRKKQVQMDEEASMHMQAAQKAGILPPPGMQGPEGGEPPMAPPPEELSAGNPDQGEVLQ